MGNLKCRSVDLNDPNVVKAITSAAQTELKNVGVYFALQHTLPYYFAMPGHTLTTDPGWYIILEGKTPIYVGEAQNLNVRLNTRTGSCDDFGRVARTRDSQRNFVKKFSEVKILTSLRVAVLAQPNLIEAAKLNAALFTNMDRKNIEKVLNIYRGMLTFL